MRVRRVQAVDVRQQHQTIGAHHLGHSRRQPVIVAVTNFGGRHRVVFVDHRHRPQGQQGIEGTARIEVAAALLGIAQSQKNLRHGDRVGIQQLFVGVREPNLADRRSRLTLLQF